MPLGILCKRSNIYTTVELKGLSLSKAKAEENLSQLLQSTPTYANLNIILKNVRAYGWLGVTVSSFMNKAHHGGRVNSSGFLEYGIQQPREQMTEKDWEEVPPLT